MIMMLKEGIFLLGFLSIVIIFNHQYKSVVPGELVMPKFPSGNSAGCHKLHSMKKMKKDIQEMELCIGRRCARKGGIDNSNKAGTFVFLTIVSLIGLFAVLKKPKSEMDHPRKCGEMLHSTGLRCDCSSLTASPMPSPIPSTRKLSPRPVRSVSNYFEDNLVWFEDFNEVSPLPTSPPKLDKIYTDSSSSSGIFPIVPPRRWRGNSKLNLAQSPEVVPKERRTPNFQVNNVSI